MVRPPAQRPRSRAPVVRAGRPSLAPGSGLAGWASLLGRPGAESPSSRLWAQVGGTTAVAALLAYLFWRALFTLPSGAHLVPALLLLAFEALPLVALAQATVTLWNIDAAGPEPVSEAGPGHRVLVLVLARDEPAEVLAPTVAAACALRPAHQTWVLDGADRPWVQELCETYGARRVHTEDGGSGTATVNAALALLEQEVAAGGEPVDVLAVLDGDDVPLPHFLTATLGWFDDPAVGLVQAPQSSYNVGSFDDGESGEQMVFFHVRLPGRNTPGDGPFWCRSAALVRTGALTGVGGVASGTSAEVSQTTLRLLEQGWRTVYHHQAIAVGLAPVTPDRYLEQRCAWALGAMELLAAEGLRGPYRRLSRRRFEQYLRGTVGWLSDLGAVLAFCVPALVLVSGARVTTASPLATTAAFAAMVGLRLWGVQLLHRRHQRWGTAAALRVVRVLVGLACLRWLLTRRLPATRPAAPTAADRRHGHVPVALWVLGGLTVAALGWAVAAATGLGVRRVPLGSVLPAALWMLLAAAVLALGLRRVATVDLATSQRNAYRAPVEAPVTVNGIRGRLVDVSVSGVAVSLPVGALPEDGEARLQLPVSDELTLQVVRIEATEQDVSVAMRVQPGDFAAYRSLALWLFHTPPGVVEGLPPHVPAIAATTAGPESGPSALARQLGPAPLLEPWPAGSRP